MFHGYVTINTFYQVALRNDFDQMELSFLIQTNVAHIPKVLDIDVLVCL